MVVRKGQTTYAVEVKTVAEGRADRLIPLWSQAYLEVMRAAGAQHAPLVVIAAPKITPRAAAQVLRFAEEHAPGAAAGVVDFDGLRLFRGPQLDALSAERAPASRRGQPVSVAPGDLFSDLNQWMLKVLLAPELPERLLTAPRGRYANASQLARAAGVSVMSAFRFVQQLQREGYLHESEPHLRLVRRDDLFRRWQASAMVRRVREVPMRFLLRADPRAELARLLRAGPACLALFAAADALQLGFVHGVPPYVHVPSLDRAGVGVWEGLTPAERGEAPDVILRQAPARQSVFRGMVRVDGTPVTDVLQVWLDVSAHPSRGAEQAALIHGRVLEPIVEGAGVGG